MRKEMIVSSSNRETKIALLEDDQVVEVFFEREREYSLASSIYKGRVTRVLPGMQSAFVDIGLERDAFLYVSDFFEDTEEYDTIVTTIEEKVSKLEESLESEGVATKSEPTSVLASKQSVGQVREAAPLAAAPERSGSEKPTHPGGEHPHHVSRHSRRHRPRRKGFPESKYARFAGSPPPPISPETPAPPPIILPGESLAKYRDLVKESATTETETVEATWEKVAEAITESPETTTATEAREPTEFGIQETRPEAEAPVPGAGEGMLPLSTTEQGENQAKEEVFPEPSSPSEPPSVQAGGGEKSVEVQGIPPEPELPPEREAAAPIAAEPPVLQTGAVEEPATQAAEWSSLAELQPEPAEEVRTEFTSAESVSSAPSVSSEPQALPESEQAEAAPGSPEETSEPSTTSRHASVREGGRAPRYQRRTRWLARRQGQAEPDRPSRRAKEPEAPKPMITDLLKEGQEIIVQIAKEPLGKKGARITSHIALPGRYLVYMPTVTHIGVSRKIASDEERQRLKRIILEHTKNISGGFIVRTAGEGHSEEDFRQDIVFLSKLWTEIKAQAEKGRAPALLHYDLSLVLRTLRDQLSEEFTAIWVDSEQVYVKILDLVSKFQPALVSRVKLYTKDVPPFEEMGVQEEINKALKPKIWLKSGGYIVINQTEALVAIDINTGKYVGRSNRLEDTIAKTNVDAIQEIVRQIRLRDLGGIIVIDFIDMDERKNRQKVMTALEEALKADRSPSKILSFNEFGLVAITRKRARQSLERTLCQPCAYCSGSGYVKSVPSICLEILAEARKLVAELKNKQVTLRVNPEVGKALKGRDSSIVQEIEEITGKTIIIRNDPTLHLESYDFD